MSTSGSIGPGTATQAIWPSSRWRHPQRRPLVSRGSDLLFGDMPWEASKFFWKLLVGSISSLGTANAYIAPLLSRERNDVRIRRKRVSSYSRNTLPGLRNRELLLRLLNRRFFYIDSGSNLKLLIASLEIRHFQDELFRGLLSKTSGHMTIRFIGQIRTTKITLRYLSVRFVVIGSGSCSVALV